MGNTGPALQAMVEASDFIQTVLKNYSGGGGGGEGGSVILRLCNPMDCSHQAPLSMGFLK